MVPTVQGGSRSAAGGVCSGQGGGHSPGMEDEKAAVGDLAAGICRVQTQLVTMSGHPGTARAKRLVAGLDPLLSAAATRLTHALTRPGSESLYSHFAAADLKQVLARAKELDASEELTRNLVLLHDLALHLAGDGGPGTPES